MSESFGSTCSLCPLFVLLLFITFLHTNQVSGLKSNVPSNEVKENQSKSCNLFEGSWVFDDSYPLYNGVSCPFINAGLNCQKNGRTDNTYLKYRWQPTSCDLSRFNGKTFLQKFRGKQIMFVGDSLSNNQWQSLACMIHSAVPESNYTLVERGPLSTLFFMEYEVSVTYLKNGFLVDLVDEKEYGRVLVLDHLSRTEHWRGVDILIFNSYHWWIHTGKSQTWDYFQVGEKIVKEMDRMEAYKIAMTTWAQWVDSNINPSKSRVFFQGISAVHYHGSEWGEPTIKDCTGQTKPVEGSTYPGDHYPGEVVIKNVLNNMTNPVYLLDIALLTQLRKDGHPSKYAGGSLDCSHWCLAGVPDAWNELLYSILLED